MTHIRAGEHVIWHGAPYASGIEIVVPSEIGVIRHNRYNFQSLLAEAGHKMLGPAGR